MESRQPLIHPIVESDRADSAGRKLFKIAGAAAMIAAGFAILQIIIEVIGVGFMRISIPSTVAGWFTILQEHPLLGLTALTLFQIPAFVLCIPLILALYHLLKPSHQNQALISTALAFLGMSIYLASNSVFSLLALSGQYAAAASSEQRNILLAAGQAMLATYEGSGVDIGLFLFMIAVLAFSSMMRRGSSFSKATAYSGILAGLVSVLYYTASPFYSNAIFILEVSGVFFVVWIFLTGRRLLQLSRANS